MCLKKVGFLKFLSHFYELAFWTKFGYFKQEIHTCPCFWLFGCCIFTIVPKYLKGHIFTKKEP